MTLNPLSTLLTCVLIAACGGNGDGNAIPDSGDGADAGAADSGTPAAPTVVSNAPLDGATGVSVIAKASATFSEAMDPDSLTLATFSVTTGTPALAIAGSIAYADSVAVFSPALPLESEQLLTATISTGAKSLSGIALAEEFRWNFTVVDTVANALPVDLATAGDFVILAKSAITSVPTSVIIGDVGVSPVTSAAVTGFALTADVTNTFSTSDQVTGRVYAASDVSPTPAKMTAAVLDMEAAFTDAAARVPDATEVGAGIIGGLNLAPGVYKWGTGVSIPTDVSLTGSATDVWIFQIADGLTMSSDAKIILAGGAVAENIFWQVSGPVVLNTRAHLAGIVLTQTAVTLGAGASFSGRMLAQTAVSIDSSTITHPEP